MSLPPRTTRALFPHLCKKMSFEGKKVFVATPCYGGMVTTAFMSSMLGLMETSIRLGVPIQFGFIYNESLVS